MTFVPYSIGSVLQTQDVKPLWPPIYNIFQYIISVFYSLLTHISVPGSGNITSEAVGKIRILFIYFTFFMFF